MKFDRLYITRHAMRRWQERICLGDDIDRLEILNAVENGRKIPKEEPLPVPTPKIPGKIYVIHEDIIFVLESDAHSEFRLITVMNIEPRKLPVTPKTKEKVRPEVKLVIPEFASLAEERRWLIEEKQRLAAEKGKTIDKKLVGPLSNQIDDRLRKIKLAWLASQKKIARTKRS